MSGVMGFSGKGRKGSNEILKTKPVFDEGVSCRHRKSRYKSGFLK
jgi:hypothetical protein